MAIRLKQSTASQEFPLGPFLDSTDGVTPETALSIANTDIKLWKMGATSLANKNSGGATHISGGIYHATLDATDTDTLGAMIAFVSVSGALPIKVEFEIVSANVYDALIGGTDYLQVDVADWKNATAPAMTGDAFARLGAPAGASVSADVAAVKSDTAAILADTAEIGVAGAGLTALPWNAAWDAEVQSECADALNAYDPPTHAELVSLLAAADDAVLTAIAALTIPTAIENADALLARDIGSGSGAGTLNERTVRAALRFIRNKWSISGATLTVTKENDSDTAWTATVSTSAGAEPVVGNDPA